MKVTNYDLNGKLIPDLSKVIIPEDIQRSVINLILKGDQYTTEKILKDEKNGDIINENYQHR